MKIGLCIIVGIVAGLHACASLMQMKKNKGTSLLMVFGSVLAAIGIALCLSNNSLDWVLALAGFAFISYAAIQNGRRKQKLHMQHHIIRISLFIVLAIGFCFL